MFMNLAWADLSSKMSIKSQKMEFSNCQAFAKRNEINQFLERMVSGDETTQTVIKPGLTAGKVKCVFGGAGK